MNLSIITKPLVKAKFGLRKNAPEIMVVSGIVGGVASAVLACRATLKVNDILDETQEKVDKIHGAANGTLAIKEGAEYHEEDMKKDLAILYAQTAFKFVKLYAPAVGLGVLSVASILGGHHILRGRNVALAAAYATIDQSFKEYRGRVVEKFGKDVDRQLRYDLKAEKITTTEVDPDTGKQKRVKKSVLVPQGDGVYSGYARMFDQGCEGWENDANLNLAFLKAQEEFANQKLRAQGYLFLSDVYKALGFRDDRASHCVGWTFDEDSPLGDNYVDFGFRENLSFMEGYEKTVILDFNVDGPILDTFEGCYKGSGVC